MLNREAVAEVSQAQARSAAAPGSRYIKRSPERAAYSCARSYAPQLRQNKRRGPGRRRAPFWKHRSGCLADAVLSFPASGRTTVTSTVQNLPSRPHRARARRSDETLHHLSHLR
jgi:hypothetical protein